MNVSQSTEQVVRVSRQDFLNMKRSDQVKHTKLMLATSNAWLLKGLIRIYERQTAAEQCVDQTQELNGVGFGAFDAEFLSNSAKRAEVGAPFSEKHLAAIRKAMLKYAGQLVRISRGEA